MKSALVLALSASLAMPSTSLAAPPDPSLPADVAKTLRRAIEGHPYYFPPPPGETVTQKVANYDVFVERTTRADVENGTIRLELKPEIRTSTKVLIGVGIVFGAAMLAFVIECATKGCD